MTAFRLVDSNNAQVRSVLHDIEKFQPIGQQILNRSNVIEVGAFNQRLLIFRFFLVVVVYLFLAGIE